MLYVVHERRMNHGPTKERLKLIYETLLEVTETLKLSVTEQEEVEYYL